MFQAVRGIGSFLQKSTHVLCNTTLITSNSLAIEANTAWSNVFLRTNIRNNFPRARENKRVKVHGWKTRLSTLSGRQILWRRILKGRHVLSH